MQFNTYTSAGAHIAAALVNDPPVDECALAKVLAGYDVHDPVPTRLQVAALRMWAGRLRGAFDAAGPDDQAAAVDALLRDSDCRPRLVSHDGQPYHLHYAPVATDLVARVKALTAAGLAHVIAEGGGHRVRCCRAARVRERVRGHLTQRRALLLQRALRQSGERGQAPGPAAGGPAAERDRAGAGHPAAAAAMSNLEMRPAEVACAERERPAPGAAEILQPRPVPLGGPRAMTVRRTLPQRQRSLIGGWCFLDHYGPDPVAQTGGMRVPPHPHTQLQTVSWLFTGEIEHRDSAGHHTLVRPGELNLMTAGRGISHSEVSTEATRVLRGVQLWVALPSAARFAGPRFQHYVPDRVRGPGFSARVFLGSLLGSTSPAATHSPLAGAEIVIAPGAAITVAADPAFEHGILVDSGTVTVNGAAVATGRLGYLGPGATAIELRAGQDTVARVLLLGGEPLGEQIVMWWNFIGRSHQEIAGYRAAWQAEIGAAPGAGGGVTFGLPAGDPFAPLPAPPLPNATLRPRG